MTPETIAALVARWARRYTRGLPPQVAERRRAELEADLHDHIAHERAMGVGERRIALGILSRMVRGLPADAAWRGEQRGLHPTAAAARRARRRAYLGASTVGLGSAFILCWSVPALGLIGEEGDPADRMYLGVLAVGLLGSLIARFRPRGMARALAAMAGAQSLVTFIALGMGKQDDPVTSLHELVGLNLFFIALYLVAAGLFRRASRQRETGPRH
jgi:hypothetical protein